ncbi:MAG: polysaccharide lyase [Chitinivibrionales bacterium]
MMKNISERWCIALLVLLLAASMFSGGWAQTSGDSDFLEPLLQQRGDILFYGGFEGDAVCSAQWESSWGIAWSQRCDQIETLTGAEAFIGDNTIRVAYPAGGVGTSSTGAQFPITFERMAQSPAAGFDSLYLRYYLKFEEGFDFRLGGKLPGLMGGDESWGISGGNHPDGTNGWTLRLMWRENGAAVVYAYLPPGEYQQGSWGLDIALNKHFIPGTWHCIEQYVCVNDIGEENGALRVWFDNELVLDRADVVFRTVDNSAGKVGGCYFSTFHGGSGSEWAPRVDSYAQFDGFVMAPSRVGLFDTPVDTESPALPSQISAVAPTDNRIDLTWHPSSDISGVSHYSVYEGDSLLGESRSTHFAVRNLHAQTNYCFSVTVTDSAGNTSDRSVPVCATTLALGFGGQLDSVILTPVADSYVRGGTAEQNYGGESGLIIKTESSAANNRRAYLRFDLSRVTGIVTRANLSLEVTSSWGEQMQCVAMRVEDDSWNEMQINYANSPPFGEMIDSVWVSETGPIVLDLASEVEQQAVQDGTLSIALLEQAGEGGSVGSRESSTPPRLVVYFYPEITVSNAFRANTATHGSRYLNGSYKKEILETDNIKKSSHSYDALGRQMRRVKQWQFHVVGSEAMKE